METMDNMENDEEAIMSEQKPSKYMCSPCGYVYDPAEGDPDHGIASGTAFEDLPSDWRCPVCGAGEDMFIKMR